MENRIVTSVNLSTNNITKDGAEAFAECLFKNRSIKELSLSLNKLGNPGAQKIAGEEENRWSRLNFLNRFINTKFYSHITEFSFQYHF